MLSSQQSELSFLLFNYLHRETLLFQSKLPDPKIFKFMLIFPSFQKSFVSVFLNLVMLAMQICAMSPLKRVNMIAISSPISVTI